MDVNGVHGESQFSMICGKKKPRSKNCRAVERLTISYGV